MSTFGRIESFARVEQLIISLAELWFNEYLAETETQLGFPQHYFPPLADWDVAKDFEKWPEEKIPFLLVMNSGLYEQPVKRGTGEWDAKILLVCSIVVSAPTRSDSRVAAHAYAAALRTMIMQHRSLGLGSNQGIRGVDYVDERPAPIASDADQTLAAMNLFFVVEVAGLMSEHGTPPEPEPRDDPYVRPPPEDPTIEADGSSVQINLKEINQ